jgi:hypothetical protein
MLLRGLVLFGLLPSLAYMGFQALRLTQQRLDEIGRTGRDLADEIGTVAERLLAERATLLKMLAASPALKAGDLGTFYQHAKAVLDPAEGVVVVTGASPKILLSTAVPFGTPLPDTTVQETRLRAAALGQPGPLRPKGCRL